MLGKPEHDGGMVDGNGGEGRWQITSKEEEIIKKVKIKGDLQGQ